MSDDEDDDPEDSPGFYLKSLSERLSLKIPQFTLSDKKNSLERSRSENDIIDLVSDEEEDMFVSDVRPSSNEPPAVLKYSPPNTGSQISLYFLFFLHLCL